MELAYRDGVLNAASLMVSAPAARDAVERAHRLPGLRVGLHLVLADGAPTLPPAAIPGLVGADGRFSASMAGKGVRFYFSRDVQRQLATEIRAQFHTFACTGLALDHVNCHKHFHLHPTVLSLILSIGRGYGMRAVRLPLEAGAPFWLRPWLSLLRRRLDAAGVAHNDQVVGIDASGKMDEAALLAALADLPDGVTEIYSHPAVGTAAPLAPTMSTYRHADELAALLSPRVRATLDTLALPRGGFADIFPDPGAAATASSAAPAAATHHGGGDAGPAARAFPAGPSGPAR